MRIMAGVKPFQVTGKLRPPRLGLVFDRVRLFQRLDELPSFAGLWIFGPPGIGKTTLVTTYLDARETRWLWLRLDGMDSDPAVFLQLLHSAVSDSFRAHGISAGVPADDD